MAEPKLELTKNRDRLNRLAYVRQQAASRTKRRIQMIIEDLAEQKAKKEGRPLVDASTKVSK